MPKRAIRTLYSANKNIKMRSFKSSENIQKKEGGPDRYVSDNQSSSVTLNELAMKARKDKKTKVSNCIRISSLHALDMAERNRVLSCDSCRF